MCLKFSNVRRNTNELQPVQMVQTRRNHRACIWNTNAYEPPLPAYSYRQVARDLKTTGHITGPAASIPTREGNSIKQVYTSTRRPGRVEFQKR